MSDEKKELTPEEAAAAAYAVPKTVTTEELLAKDQDDDALNKYKESLLGGGGGDSKAKYPDDPRKLILEEVTIEAAGRDPIKIDPYAEKVHSFVLKEGIDFKVRFKFYVQHDVLFGLKYSYSVTRLVPVDSAVKAMGSYAAKAELVEFSYDDFTPSGFFARGHYKCNGKIIDDDKNVYADFSYEFDLKKGWE